MTVPRDEYWREWFKEYLGDIVIMLIFPSRSRGLAYWRGEYRAQYVFVVLEYALYFLRPTNSKPTRLLEAAQDIMDVLVRAFSREQVQSHEQQYTQQLPPTFSLPKKPKATAPTPPTAKGTLGLGREAPGSSHGPRVISSSRKKRSSTAIGLLDTYRPSPSQTQNRGCTTALEQLERKMGCSDGCSNVHPNSGSLVLTHESISPSTGVPFPTTPPSIKAASVTPGIKSRPPDAPTAQVEPTMLAITPKPIEPDLLLAPQTPMRRTPPAFQLATAVEDSNVQAIRVYKFQYFNTHPSLQDFVSRFRSQHGVGDATIARMRVVIRRVAFDIAANDESGEWDWDSTMGKVAKGGYAEVLVRLEKA